jgi:hypothetical protein
MSSALLAILFATLGAGLVATSAACLALWRRVRSLTVPSAPSSPVVVPVPRAIVAPRPAFDRAGSELVRRLDELTGKHQALEARLAKVEASTAAAAISGPLGPRRRPARRADFGRAATSAGPTLISVPDLATPPSIGSTSEVAAELDRRYGPVWLMADEGLTVDDIARETGYPVGQVELILGLRRRLVAAEAMPDA